jgi:hypothetical protein
LPKTVKAYALTNALTELRDKGEAHYIGEGKRGNPYRYWKKERFGTTTLKGSTK